MHLPTVHTLNLGFVQIKSRVHDALLEFFQINRLAAIHVQNAKRSENAVLKQFHLKFLYLIYICVYPDTYIPRYMCMSNILLQKTESPICKGGAYWKPNKNMFLLMASKSKNPNKNMLEPNKEK